MKKKEIKKSKCYYNDDDWCDGKVTRVNSFHKYLCKKCEDELNNMDDERLDNDFNIDD